MTLSVSQVWNRARDHHPALSALNAPFPLALRRVADYQRSLVDAITAEVPAFFAKVLEVTLPLADFDAGIVLDTEIPAGQIDLRTAIVTYANNTQAETTFVPWEQRLVWSRRPAYTLRDGVLYFVGPETAYAQAATFQLTYAPLVVDPTTLASLLVLPDDARDCLALMLAGFYMKRLVSEPMHRISDQAANDKLAEGAAARAQFLDRIFRIKKRQRYVMRNVGPRP